LAAGAGFLAAGAVDSGLLLAVGLPAPEPDTADELEGLLVDVADELAVREGLPGRGTKGSRVAPPRWRGEPLVVSATAWLALGAAATGAMPDAPELAPGALGGGTGAEPDPALSAYASAPMSAAVSSMSTTSTRRSSRSDFSEFKNSLMA